MKAVKFLKGGYLAYGTKDIAGFENEVADYLVKEGLAEVICESVEKQANVIETECPLPMETPKLKAFTCPVCGNLFKSEKPLKTHLWKKHKIK